MKKQTGFTLIELIIVIVILGILSATAIPRFINLQDDAREAAMIGLKSALESASSLTHYQAIIKGLGDKANEDLAPDREIRYGYPRAVQGDLKLILNLNNEDDWKFSGSGTEVIFTLARDTEDMTVAEISSNNVCKLIYKEANKGERPVITISGCKD